MDSYFDYARLLGWDRVFQLHVMDSSLIPSPEPGCISDSFQLHVMDSVDPSALPHDYVAFYYFQLHVMDSMISTPEPYVPSTSLSTPCNGFTKPPIAPSATDLKLSTPCNGFLLLTVIALLDLWRGHFQLHVMDSQL